MLLKFFLSKRNSQESFFSSSYVYSQLKLMQKTIFNERNDNVSLVFHKIKAYLMILIKIIYYLENGRVFIIFTRMSLHMKGDYINKKYKIFKERNFN